PLFGGTQANSNAINDLGCRFEARTQSSLACTRDGFQQTEAFVDASSTIQFCTNPGVGSELTFPFGDTTLTARALDVIGQPGPPKSMVIRVLPNGGSRARGGWRAPIGSPPSRAR